MQVKSRDTFLQGISSYLNTLILVYDPSTLLGPAVNDHLWCRHHKIPQTEIYRFVILTWWTYTLLVFKKLFKAKQSLPALKCFVS